MPSKKTGARAAGETKEFVTAEGLATPPKGEPKKRGRKAKAKEKEREDKQMLLQNGVLAAKLQGSPPDESGQSFDGKGFVKLAYNAPQ